MRGRLVRASLRGGSPRVKSDAQNTLVALRSSLCARRIFTSSPPALFIPLLLSITRHHESHTPAHTQVHNAKKLISSYKSHNVISSSKSDEMPLLKLIPANALSFCSYLLSRCPGSASQSGLWLRPELRLHQLQLSRKLVPPPPRLEVQRRAR